MNKSRKHSTDFSKQLLDYLQGKLSKEQQYAFEKNINADDFDFEALEGLENHPPESLEHDLKDIQSRLSEKSRKKRISPWLAAAATIGLLIIGFTTWYFIDPLPQTDQLADQPEGMILEKPDMSGRNNNQIEAQPKNEASLPAKPATDDTNARVVPNLQKKQTPPEETTSEAEIIHDQVIREESDISMDLIKEEMAMPQIKPETKTLTTASEPPVKIMEEKSRAASASEFAKPAKKQQTNLIKGKILDAETREPLPGATINIQGTDDGTITDLDGNFAFVSNDVVKPESLDISYIGYGTKSIGVKDSIMEVYLSPDLLALDEVVVVGYGVENKHDATGSVSTIDVNKEYAENNNRRAQPADGYMAFRKYIRENIRVPDERTGGNNYVVDLNLHINNLGNIEQIDILESPGKAYSAEARRLLQEGPEWLPKLNNGTPVSSEVKIKIKFKE